MVDGDKVIAICAKRMLDEGTLAKNTAVVTVMSNMGFFKSAKRTVLPVKRRQWVTVTCWSVCCKRAITSAASKAGM